MGGRVRSRRAVSRLRRSRGALCVGAVGSTEEGGGDVAHLVEFPFGKRVGFLAGFGEEDELPEIAEGGGAAGGDAISAEGFEDTL